MICDSTYWKEDLRRRSISLQKRLGQRRWTERSFALIEQELMLGFYSIRKLLESNKISNAVTSICWPLTSYVCRDEVTQLNRHALNDLYDLSRDTVQPRDITFVCNQFIHSYVFTLTFSDKDRLDGVFVSSDRERNTQVFHLRIVDIAALFDRVVNDSPNLIRMSRNKQRKDFDVEVFGAPRGQTIALIADEGNNIDENLGVIIKSSLLRGLPLLRGSV